ncbi:MAG TPA: (d)CMP kinase [Pyrinomonadaceae bacterium]|nr:(d)CMP kinase [Pyrinomonadaceae bacterium]
MIIAIDGPSGSGKSTLGRMLARELNLLYIDTGSMYRAVALATIEARIDPADKEAVVTVAEIAEIDLQGDPDSLKVSLNDRDVTDEIRTETVTEMSSVVSTIPGVRRAMVARQREMGQRGAVLNGRDIGTVVFPDADIKFFLTAEPEERAERRFKEDLLTNSSVSLEQTLSEMIERDRRDSTRADSPLKIADDAIVIDSSGLTIEQVFARMMEHVHRHH